MAAINQNFTVWAGDTVSLRFPIYNKDGIPAPYTAPVGYFAADANAAGLTGDTPILAKHSPASGATIAQETVDGVDGVWVLTVFLTEANTQVIESGVHYYEVRILDGVSVMTVATGTITIRPTIIRE